jgi:hypothetical protein
VAQQKNYTLSLLINGRNICSDSNGCDLYIWAYNSSGTTIDGVSNGPDPFIQDANNHWFEEITNHSGINGDTTNSRVIDYTSGSFSGDLDITDDSSFIPEQSADALSIHDGSATTGFNVSVCDF